MSSGKGIKTEQSVTDLCQSAVKEVSKPEDVEKIFTSAILPPLYLVAAYLVVLNYMAKGLYAQVPNAEKAKELGDKYDYTTKENDPFKQVWVIGPIFFTFVYLGVVYFGQKWMKNKQPFQIQPYVFTYNLYQCILNLWCVVAMIWEVYSNPHFTGIWGNSPQKTIDGYRITFLVWVHYNNKYIELLDTLWMILKKKDKQISFLHCYHHVLLIWAWFFVCRFEAGGDCYFGATVNSFIHVIMYGYYTLALLKISCPWKQWITNCQMLQFCACLAHSIYVLIKGNMPWELPAVQAFVMINMLILFGQFYVKAYSKKKNDDGSSPRSANNKKVE